MVVDGASEATRLLRIAALSLNIFSVADPTGSKSGFSAARSLNSQLTLTTGGKASSPGSSIHIEFSEHETP